MTDFSRYLRYSTLSVFLASLLSGSTNSQSSGQNGSDQNVCMEPHCIILAADILSSLDTTQDPCNSFYDFANGGWFDKTPLPAARPSISRFEQSGLENTYLLQRILDPSDGNTTSNFDEYDKQMYQKLSDGYSSCLNTTQLDMIGIAPLKDFIQELRQLYRGGGSNSTGGNTTQGGLTAALAFLHSQDISSFFFPYLDGDRGEPDHMLAYIDQPEFALPSKEIYQIQPIVQLLQTQVEGFLTIFRDGGSNNDTGGFKELAKSVVDFESRMVNASLDLVSRRDQVATYNRMNATEFYDMLPQIDFPTYFASLNSETSPKNVVSIGPSYIQGLSKILDETSDEIIESYLVYRSAFELYNLLGMNTPAWDVGRILTEVLAGVPSSAVRDRGETCVGSIQTYLGFGLGRFFVNATFSPEEREHVTSMIGGIVKTFAGSLDGLDWMDEESAKAAAEKASNLAIKVGYPLYPNTTSSKAIADFHSAVDINKDKHFENMMSARKNWVLQSWSRLEMAREKEAWMMDPVAVNAYYNPTGNEIVFPAGILQPPFHSEDWPTYLSYGGFGAIAGHELTHAFDSNGRQFDQNGKLQEWWTNKTVEGFQVHQDCIVKQYDAYTIDDGQGGQAKVNGILTSGENVGDSGLIQSLRTWKNQFDESAKAGHEYLLPGLNYTQEQLFFINFARIWAQNIRPEAAVQVLQTDAHSPTRYRVEGTITNVPEFAKAFNCPEGSKFNPPKEQQCIFWG